MNKAYYKEYFTLERNHWWFRIREGIIKLVLTKHTKGRKDLKILNVGTATGRTSEMLHFFGNVTSLEYDQDCCDFVNETLSLNVIQGSITELPFQDEMFDVVCAFDVIEHVENDSLAVKEMNRVCKNDGFLYVTIPAFQSLWSHHDVVNQHFRRYKLKQIKDLFIKNTKGEPVYKSYFNFFLFPPIFFFRFIQKILPQRLIRKGAGSDFMVAESKFTDKLLGKIFAFEKPFIRNSFSFPFGVSIIFLWKKLASDSSQK